jgi:hypothetical protein
MKTILIIILAIFSFNMFSQNYTIKYSYDDAGNRIQRKQVPIIMSNKISQVTVDTLIEEIADKNIKLYPNPVNETLNIFVEEYNGEIGNINLYSLDGRLITNEKITQSNTKLDFKNQPQGSYIVKININDKTKKYTIIKQ